MNSRSIVELYECKMCKYISKHIKYYPGGPWIKEESSKTHIILFPEKGYKAEDLPSTTEFKIQRISIRVSVTPGKPKRNKEIYYNFSCIITIIGTFLYRITLMHYSFFSVIISGKVKWFLNYSVMNSITPTINSCLFLFMHIHSRI